MIIVCLALFFFWPLYCTPFYALRLLITTLLSSSFHDNYIFSVNRCFFCFVFVFLKKNSSSLSKIINTMYIYGRVSLCIIFHYFSFNISFNVVFIELNHDLIELVNRMSGVLVIVSGLECGRCVASRPLSIVSGLECGRCVASRPLSIKPSYKYMLLLRSARIIKELKTKTNRLFFFSLFFFILYYLTLCFFI